MVVYGIKSFIFLPEAKQTNSNIRYCKHKRINIWFLINYCGTKRIKPSAVIRDLDWAEIKMRSDVIVGYCGQRNADSCSRMWPSRNLLLLHLYISLCCGITQKDNEQPVLIFNFLYLWFFVHFLCFYGAVRSTYFFAHTLLKGKKQNVQCASVKKNYSAPKYSH